MAARKYNRGRVHRDELRAQATELAETRATRTDAQQLERLDKGSYRAVKERARLKKRIANPRRRQHDSVIVSVVNE